MRMDGDEALARVAIDARACIPSENFRFPLYLFCTWTSGFERI